MLGLGLCEWCCMLIKWCQYPCWLKRKATNQCVYLYNCGHVTVSCLPLWHIFFVRNTQLFGQNVKEKRYICVNWKIFLVFILTNHFFLVIWLAGPRCYSCFWSFSNQFYLLAEIVVYSLPWTWWVAHLQQQRRYRLSPITFHIMQCYCCHNSVDDMKIVFFWS